MIPPPAGFRRHESNYLKAKHALSRHHWCCDSAWPSANQQVVG